MLIFILPSWYKSKRYPGNCLFVYEQVEALQRLGHQCVVLSVQQIAIQQAYRYRPQISCVKEDNGIVTYYTDALSIVASKYKALYTHCFGLSLQRLMKRAVADFGMPDVLYAHFTFPAGFCGLKIAEQYNLPLVVEEHNSAIMESCIDATYKKYLKKAVNQSNAFIAVSEGLKESIQLHIGKCKDIVVVSNMINSCFRYYPNEYKGGPFIFFAMGGLIPRKGFDLLIPAFAKAFNDDADTQLYIAGQGPEREHLLALISQYAMRERIHLVGQLSREETLEYFKKCHCFVLPSRAETFGLVYREALAVGRPIITTRHGGFCVNDWHEDFGIQVDVDDEKGLINALCDMRNNYYHYQQEYISRLCLDTCSADNVAVAIEHVLQTTIHNHKNVPHAESNI